MYQEPRGNDQRVLLICVKYTDSLLVANPDPIQPPIRHPRPLPMRTAAEWAGLLNAEVNDFFQRATYGQTSFRFEAPEGGPADGWFDMGRGGIPFNYWHVGQDAIDRADPHVDFRQYNRVVVLQSWPVWGGQGLLAGGWYWYVSEGAEAVDLYPRRPGQPPPPPIPLPVPAPDVLVGLGVRWMTLSVVSDGPEFWDGEPGDGVVAGVIHELGHALGIQSHYSDFIDEAGWGRDSISPWDVMGYGAKKRHFLGWAKLDRGWLPASRVFTVPTDVAFNEPVWIEPLERAGSGVQLAKIPFTSAPPFRGLCIENRQLVNGDERLPESGVLVTLVDEDPTVNVGFKAKVLTDPQAPRDLSKAPLVLGQSLVHRGIKIAVVDQAGENLAVHIDRPVETGPDLAITPWNAPPWETPDIWIDSEMNGWGTYRYADAARRPVGQGDDAWVGRENRVYIRIRNLGTADATDVRVNVSVNQPPGLGDAGPGWDLLDSIAFPTVPADGTPVEGYVLWRPEVASHTCIRAEIVESSGELWTSNNFAQENVSLFESSSRSPYEPAWMTAQVFNPLPTEVAVVRVGVRDVPKGWGYVVSPQEMELKPGEVGEVNFAVYPSVGEKVNERLKNQRVGFMGRVSLEAVVTSVHPPVTMGGISTVVHLVEPTELSLGIKADPKGLRMAGRLQPSVNGATVAVEVRPKRGKRTVVFATSDAKGGFRAVYKTEKPFTGYVQAFFAGDGVHRSAESEIQKM